MHIDRKRRRRSAANKAKFGEDDANDKEVVLPLTGSAQQEVERACQQSDHTCTRFDNRRRKQEEKNQEAPAEFDGQRVERPILIWHGREL